jgi:hypothetical protein
MKRVLMISYVFAPMAAVGGHRVAKFAKFLPEFGWEPTVLTVRSGFNYAFDESLLDELPHSLQVIRTRGFEPVRWWERETARWKRGAPRTGDEHSALASAGRRGGMQAAGLHGEGEEDPARTGGLSGLKRLATDLLTTPDEQVWWVPFAVAGGLRAIAGGIDLLYTTSPPHSTHLIGWLLSGLSGLPWVADFRDLWTSNIHFLPARRGGGRERIERWLEARVLRDASAVIATSRRSRRQLISQIRSGAGAGGEAEDRCFTITNGFDPDDFGDGENGGRARRDGRGSNVRESSAENRENQTFVVTFLGSLYGDRSPDALLAGLGKWFAEDPRVRSSVRVQLIGNKSPETAERLRGVGLPSSIEVRPHTPHRQALALLRRSNLLLLLLGGGQENAGVVPAKFFEYLYAGPPILALVPEGEAAAMVRRLAQGSVVTDGDPGSVACELRYWHRVWRGEVDPPSPAAPVDLASYHRRALASELARVFDYVREDRTP